MVTLSSSGAAAATVPASVAVLAGATSATFSVATAAVTATANVTVSASYGGVTRTANLAVMVAGSISRVFGYDTIDGFSYASHNWPLANNQQVQPATLTEPGLLTSIRTYFYSVADAPGSAMRVRGLVYADAAGAPGALIAVTPEVSSIVGGAWRDLPLATPVALPPGTYWIGIWGDTSQDALSRPGVNRYKPVTYSSTGPAQRAPPGCRIATAAWTAGSSGPSAACTRPPIESGSRAVRWGGARWRHLDGDALDSMPMARAPLRECGAMPPIRAVRAARERRRRHPRRKGCP